VALYGSLADGIAGQVSPFSGERMGSICLDGLTGATVVKKEDDDVFPPSFRDIFAW